MKWRVEGSQHLRSGEDSGMVRTSYSVWLRRLVALGLLVATTLIWPASAPLRLAEGQEASPLADPATAPVSSRGVPVERNTGPVLTAKQKRELLKSRFEKMKDDAAQLATEANDLHDELDRSSVDILSLDVIQKAEKIEKLAKKIKDEAKGY
jgi:hypothetical protein